MSMITSVDTKRCELFLILGDYCARTNDTQTLLALRTVDRRARIVADTRLFTHISLVADKYNATSERVFCFPSTISNMPLPCRADAITHGGKTFPDIPRPHLVSNSVISSYSGGSGSTISVSDIPYSVTEGSISSATSESSADTDIMYGRHFWRWIFENHCQEDELATCDATEQLGLASRLTFTRVVDVYGDLELNQYLRVLRRQEQVDFVRRVGWVDPCKNAAEGLPQARMFVDYVTPRDPTDEIRPALSALRWPAGTERATIHIRREKDEPIFYDGQMGYLTLPSTVTEVVLVLEPIAARPDDVEFWTCAVGTCFGAALYDVLRTNVGIRIVGLELVDPAFAEFWVDPKACRSVKAFADRILRTARVLDERARSNLKFTSLECWRKCVSELEGAPCLPHAQRWCFGP